MLQGKNKSNCTASEMSTGALKPEPWKRTVTVPASAKAVEATAAFAPERTLFFSANPVGSLAEVTFPNNAFETLSPADT